MKIKTPMDLFAVESWQELRRYAAQILNDVVGAINGGIDLIDNCDSSVVTTTYGLSGQEQALQHKLGRVPRGYMVIKRSAVANLYDGTKENTDKVIYLRSDGAATLTILIF